MKKEAGNFVRFFPESGIIAPKIRSNSHLLLVKEIKPPKLKNTMIRAHLLSALLISGAAPAATISTSISNSLVADSTTSVNLTTEGVLDWWAFASDTEVGTITPTYRKATTGVGSIVSAITTGATNEAAPYNNATNDYAWTNGSPTLVVGSLTTNFDRLVMATGAQFVITTTVASAGSYTLRLYSAVFNLDVTSTSTLTNAGVSSSPVLSDVPNGLYNNYWTVNFTTDGPDTLISTFTSSGPGNIFALEAVTLIPEPSSAALLGLGLAGLLRRRRR